MPQQLEDNAEQALRVKRLADGFVPAGVDRSIRFVVWLVVLTFGIAGAWWTLKGDVTALRDNQAELAKRVAINEASVTSLHTVDNAVALQIQTILSTMDTNRKDREAAVATVRNTEDAVTERVKELEEHDKIIFPLYQHGISFKEAFFETHGWAAPSNPAAERTKHDN